MCTVASLSTLYLLSSEKGLIHGIFPDTHGALIMPGDRAIERSQPEVIIQEIGPPSHLCYSNVTNYSLNTYLFSLNTYLFLSRLRLFSFDLHF